MNGLEPIKFQLPPSTLEGASERRFGIYIHVPFCAVRCGYCDFNTYTAAELGGGGSRAEYPENVEREIAFASDAMTERGLPNRPVSTVFFGGGTPTLMPVAELIGMLDAVRNAWGLTPDVEVTTEANPDSVTPEGLKQLREAGFTRVSFGMQSAVRHVLATLDRTHDPARIPHVVQWAKDAGLKVSLDLIYGTPGESVDDWRTSIETALACDVDHISAYALVIEQGTKMAAQVRRGVLPNTDDDDLAVKYELADDAFSAVGLEWYEISNWARGTENFCHHNINYWSGGDWWGIGPGAHSHIGGMRWWNVKHPSTYAQRLASGDDGRVGSPAAGIEILDDDARYLEDVLLQTRLASGMEFSKLRSGARAAVAQLVEDGLAQTTAAAHQRVVLTRRGRLLADSVVRALT